MKLVVQRVSASAVRVDDREIARIGRGLMILFGAQKGDTDQAVPWLVDKAANLRIFPDEQGKMNRSCLDINGEVLVVSQFTLAGDCSRGRRPGFENAAPPDEAERLYRLFVDAMTATGLSVQEGRFAAHMDVDIHNEGPVTFLLER